MISFISSSATWTGFILFHYFVVYFFLKCTPSSILFFHKWMDHIPVLLKQEGKARCSLRSKIKLQSFKWAKPNSQTCFKPFYRTSHNIRLSLWNIKYKNIRVVVRFERVNLLEHKTGVCHYHWCEIESKDIQLLFAQFLFYWNKVTDNIL